MNSICARLLKKFFSFVLAVLLISVGLTEPAFAHPSQPMPDSGSASFGNWSFYWEIGNANDEGLILKNVMWKGVKVLSKASLPVVRVKYRGSGSSIEAACGPWADRISSGNIERLAGQFTDVIARNFDNNILELAVFSQIGGYDLYQAYYFHKFGRLEPVLHSSGWSCGQDGSANDHKHHPYWRLDFDIDGTSNRVRHILTTNTGTTSTVTYSKESGFFTPSDTSAIVWTVANSNTGKFIRLAAPANEQADSLGSPWFGFGNRDMHIRTYKKSEDIGWEFSPTSQLGFFTPQEVTENTDIVFWSIGHLFHQWTLLDKINPQWHTRSLTIDTSW
jgi:hypothetical protein